MALHKVEKTDPAAAGSFHIPSKKGYSEYWRKNKSPVEVRELSNLLSVLKKVSSYIGRNVGQIVWEGMKYKEAIVLDPLLVTGQYPVPADKTDLVVGLTIQKAYQKIEWSKRFESILRKQLAISDKHSTSFLLFFDTAELIYVDILSNRSVFGLYTEKTRRAEILKNRIEYIQYPTIKGLLYLWWEVAADRSGPKIKAEDIQESVKNITDPVLLEKFYIAPLIRLNSVIPDIINNCLSIERVTERGNYRISIYEKLWMDLLTYVKGWRYDSVSFEDQFLSGTTNIDVFDQENEEKSKERTIKLADQIEKTIEKREVDFTDEVKENVLNKEKVVTVQKNDIVIPPRNKIDKELLFGLQQTLKSISRRRTIVSRGLKTGTIDKRRLYRAALAGNVFQYKENYFELDNNIILLLDASHSMAYKWDVVETCVLTLYEALTSFDKNTRVFAYSGKGLTCNITELSIGNKLYSIYPQGKTASGEAVMAVAMSMKKTAKNPFIIHITDGACNTGCGMQDAINYCWKKKIIIMALGYSCNDEKKESLKEEYGNLVKFLENNKQLPNMMKDLLTTIQTRFRP